MPAQPENTWRGAGLVLVVDDEETVRVVTARALEHMGFTVLTAPDGRAAVELFDEHAPKVRCVLLDMTMPQMSGEQAFQAIREVRPDAAVVLMSGYSEIDTGHKFPGRAGFIQKPFDLASLQSVVRTALGE